jgi:hypothetical protein
MNKRILPEEERNDALHKRFGPAFMVYENAVFTFMSRMTEGSENPYVGGYWEFAETENGGFFMFLDTSKRYTLCNEGNYSDIEMSAESASVAVNIYACSHLSFKYQDRVPYLSENYYLLMDYVADLPESGLIYSAID